MLRSALCRTSYASLATRLSQINQIQQQLFVRGAPSAIQVGQQFCGTQQSRLASTSVDTSSNRRSSNESAMDFLRGSTSSLRSKSRRGGQSQDKPRFKRGENQTHQHASQGSEVSAPSEPSLPALLHYTEKDPNPLYADKPLPDFMREYGTVLNMIKMEDLVNAGVHYGHHKGIWNPKMEPYLYGVREDTHIFDLEQTVAHLRRALDVLRHVTYHGGMVLFIGNRPKVEKLIRHTAITCGEYYVTEKWRGGCLSNGKNVLQGRAIPDLVVFLTLPMSKGALYECNLMNIPSIGILDSDQDPFSVTYPIPGNDDTVSAMEIYCNLMEKAVIEGKYCRANQINLIDYRL